ncbi:MAG TPA: DUF4118 domain-containing protein [Thermoanaerobaculia bacterium]|nr:DUF4118 domain-containing protein [Thermoanaerobaculia bacterium]
MASSAAVVVAAVLARSLDANATTAALVLNLIVVIASVWGRFVVGAAAALAAGLTFNFFFLQPTGSFHIASPEDWLSFGLFLFASALTSRVVSLSLERAERANARQRDIETLYDLTFGILSREAHGEALEAALGRAIESLQPQRGGYVEFHDQSTHSVLWFGEPPTTQQDQRLRTVRIHQQVLSFANGKLNDHYAPVRVGATSRGVIVLIGTAATMAAVEAMGSLMSLALEREDLITTRMHVEALREGDALRTSFFRAVSHDLSTPLAAISIHAESLLRTLTAQHQSLPAVQEILQESARLRRRIQSLLSLARLDAGKIKLSPEPTPPADLFRAAREHLTFLTQSRSLKVEVSNDCRDAFVDPLIATEILVNLVENADRAAPAGGEIELIAMNHGATSVRLGVLDRGAGIGEQDPGEQSDRLADLPHKGLGLEIVRSFVTLSGGQFALEGREGGGTAAWLSLPSSRQVQA